LPPSPSVFWPDGSAENKEPIVADIVFLALTAAFFAASFGLVYLFERLREHK
jgi:hypothetical protein